MRKAILAGVAVLALGQRGAAAMMEKDQELIKVYKGRWELVGAEGKEQKKAGTAKASCVLTASELKKAKGEGAVKEALAALEDLYANRDKLQTATLFRQVEPSEEIIGLHQGEEFLLEKMFSTRESIERFFPDKSDKNYALLKELARLCKS